MATTVLDVLQERLEEQKRMFVDSMVLGKCKDYAEYRELCGVLRGLTTAQREYQDLARKLLNEDDPDE